MGHGAAVRVGALAPVASTDSGVECGWDCMADKRLVYGKYRVFKAKKQAQPEALAAAVVACSRIAGTAVRLTFHDGH